MFEHFTFGAVSQGQQHDIHPSPKDTTYLSPPSPPHSPSDHCYFSSQCQESININDIVDKFSTQSLSRDPLAAEFATWNTMSLEVDSDEEMPSVSYLPLLPPYMQTSPVPWMPVDAPNAGIGLLRLQRQLNVQLQTSSTSHIRDIDTRVSDMITTSSQCRLHRPSSRHYLPSPPFSSHSQLIVDSEPIEGQDLRPHIVIDEGFHEAESIDDLIEELTLRRASTPSGIRKYLGGMRYRRSADVICVNGRAKVKCTPRMRKRRKARAPSIQSVPE